MRGLYYTGLDILKKAVAYCIKTLNGPVVDQGTIPADRQLLRTWDGSRSGPWIGAMEATLFTGWV